VTSTRLIRYTHSRCYGEEQKLHMFFGNSLIYIRYTYSSKPSRRICVPFLFRFCREHQKYEPSVLESLTTTEIKMPPILANRRPLIPCYCMYIKKTLYISIYDTTKLFFFFFVFWRNCYEIWSDSCICLNYSFGNWRGEGRRIKKVAHSREWATLQFSLIFLYLASCILLCK
jgi:hypothetical protein